MKKEILNAMLLLMEEYTDKQLIQMLTELMQDKEKAEKNLTFLENILSKNNIYFLVFTLSEQIIYHNIPDKIGLDSLRDCGYILDEENLQKIRNFMKLSKGNDLDVTLKSGLLKFTLFTQDAFSELFFLQLNLFHQPEDFQELHEEDDLRQTEANLDDIQKALSLLDEIRCLDITTEKAGLHQKIQDRYLAGLNELRNHTKDPIINLCLQIIEKNLTDLVTPANSLSNLYKILTPSEIRVAEFIRMGKTSQDIADTLDIAKKTVENHRNKMRDKLGLKNKGANLRSYLMQLDK